MKVKIFFKDNYLKIIKKNLINYKIYAINIEFIRLKKKMLLH